MGQNSKWHTEHLNRYISDLTKTIRSIRSIDNYHSNQHFISNDNANDRNGNHFLHSPSGSSNSNNVIEPSDSLSTLSTTAILNGTIQSHTRQQLHNISSSLVDRLSDVIQSALTTELQSEHANSSVAKLNDEENHNGSIISNYWLVLLIILYCVVVLGGIFGNASLIVTLFTQSSARLRNPLLVALCLADLTVTGVAAPLTVIALVLDARNAITSTFICKLIHFFQVRLRLSASWFFFFAYIRNKSNNEL